MKERLLRLHIAVHRCLCTLRVERGAAGVEYGILVAAIAAVIIVIVFAVGLKVEGLFQSVNTGW
jgi:pilus assembly protein Flp/PilA